MIHLGDIPVIALESNGGDRVEVVSQLAEQLLREKWVKSTYPVELVQRENMHPTGLLVDDIGIAIPHTDCEHVEKSVIGISKLVNQVKFFSMENANETISVSYVFMLAISNPQDHLKVLKWIMRVMQLPEVKESIKASSNSTELLKAVTNVPI